MFFYFILFYFKQLCSKFIFLRIQANRPIVIDHHYYYFCHFIDQTHLKFNCVIHKIFLKVLLLLLSAREITVIKFSTFK